MAADLALLLIPGAGMGPWIWDRVRGKLPAPAVEVERKAKKVMLP